jgi:hypothetical protein
VRAFIGGSAILESGDTFTIDPSGTIVWARQVSRIPSGVSTGPRLSGGEFIRAWKVNSAARGVAGVEPGEFLGLWRRRNDWFVGGYRIRADGRISTVKPLITSQLPLLSVSYLPSPDTNTGQVGLVQKLDDQSVKLISFDWNHSSWFAG